VQFLFDKKNIPFEQFLTQKKKKEVQIPDNRNCKQHLSPFFFPHLQTSKNNVVICKEWRTLVPTLWYTTFKRLLKSKKSFPDAVK
jgi:hypothetical protein